jgi:topoisomerase IV subunit A
MSDEIKDKNEINEENTPQEHSDYKPVNRFDASAVHHLSGMYQNWFLDYASYVILERAVPHIEDGLKPVQRRILHSMKRMDDGRYNKVANIVGHTMQFHPHGDASIGDALVQMGVFFLKVGFRNLIPKATYAKLNFSVSKTSPYVLWV